MNLSVRDRLVTLTVLPKEGNYATLKILTTLRLSLSFTEEEIKGWGLTVCPETGLTSWEKSEEVDIPIGEKATDIIVAAFKKFDREKKLTEEMLSTYEKFIPTT